MKRTLRVVDPSSKHLLVPRNQLIDSIHIRPGVLSGGGPRAHGLYLQAGKTSHSGNTCGLTNPSITNRRGSSLTVGVTYVVSLAGLQKARGIRHYN